MDMARTRQRSQSPAGQASANRSLHRHRASVAESEQFVLFGDLLGFAASVIRDADQETSALTRQVRGCRARPVKTPPPTRRYFSGHMQEFAVFHGHLEEAFEEHDWNGPATFVTFSDSFFVAASTLSTLIEFAELFMRSAICERLPLRCGMAMGTFVAHRFAQEYEGDLHSHSAQFLGTGVVRAYFAAEWSGVKGLRILLHPSLTPMIHASVRLLRLPRKEITEHAAQELSYVWDHSERHNPGHDEELISCLDRMRAEATDVGGYRQYPQRSKHWTACLRQRSDHQ